MMRQEEREEVDTDAHGDLLCVPLGCRGRVSSTKVNSRCNQRRWAMDRHIDEACEAIHALSPVARRPLNAPLGLHSVTEPHLEARQRLGKRIKSSGACPVSGDSCRSSGQLLKSPTLGPRLPELGVLCREGIAPRPLDSLMLGIFDDVEEKLAARIVKSEDGLTHAPFGPTCTLTV